MTFILLAGILLINGIIRFGRIDVPLERDEGEYAYAGQLILQGIAPYERVYNMKYPGIYAAYATILYLFGETHSGVHLALLFINAMTCVLIFLLARHLLGDFPAVASAAVFSVLSLSQSVQGIHANAEHFVILFSMGGLYILILALEKDAIPLSALAGVLLGTSFVMKQHGIAFGALAITYIPLSLIVNGRMNLKTAMRHLAVFLSGYGGIYLLLLATLFGSGVFHSFWFWTTDYARAYVLGVPLNLAFNHLIPKISAIFKSAPLLVMLSCLGVVFLFSKRIGREPRIFFLLFIAYSALSICPGFYFRPHYFILTLPCAAMLAGIALNGLSDLLPAATTPFKRKIYIYILLLLCVSHTIFTNRAYLFCMSPLQVSRSTYWLNPFPESIEIAKFIKKHTTGEEYIAVLGSEPQIFFYSQRRSSSGFIYMYPMMEEHEFALQMQKDFIREIEQYQPSYIVYVNVPTSWSVRRNSHKLLFEWFRDYKTDRLELVGIIELLDDGANYDWEPDLTWQFDSQYWVAVFRNKNITIKEE